MAFSIWALVIAIGTIVVFGFGGAFIWWFKMQKPKIFWHALCYQVGEGVKDIKVNKKGQAITPYKTKDLIPYMEDQLIKEDKAPGITLYRLVGLNLTTSPVSADMVELWRDKKIVRVLIQNEQATLLKSGYDEEAGRLIFKPMKRERIDLLASQIITKKNRYEKGQDGFMKAMSVIAVIVFMLGLVASSYFIANGWLKSTEVNAAATEKLGEDIIKATEINREILKNYAASSGLTIDETEKNIYGKQPEEEKKPPISVE